MRRLRLRVLLAVALMFPLVLGAATRFAVIGDYGVDDANELAVANLVATNFRPEFVVTTGDNNYIGEANIDAVIGQYYHQFIGSYVGRYGMGASSNRFFPALGNHDWYDGNGYATHLNYFTLPGNERYYDFVRGPVHLLIVNSDSHEPDGAIATSTQAQWLSNRLANSISPWRVVVFQDPPYSSASPVSRMRWPFKEWGASIVVSGHAHHYERIWLDGFSYLVNGAGGAGLAGFGNPITGSVVRYNAAHGAMLVTATHTNIIYEFWSVANGGTLIDRFTQTSEAHLAISFQTNSIRISWPTNGTDGLTLQTASALPAIAWLAVPQAPIVSGNQKVVSVPATGQRQFFRLKR